MGEGWGEANTLATSANFLGRLCLSETADGSAVAAWTADSDTGSQLWATVFGRDVGWSEAIAIGAPSGTFNEVACAMDATGSGLLTWTAYEGDKAVLNAVRFEPETGFGQPERLDQTELNAFALSLAVDGVGNALVLWNAWLGDLEELWWNRYVVGEGWQEPILLPTTSGQSLSDVDVVLDHDGNGIGGWTEQATDGSIHAAWVMAFTADGAWQEPELLASGTDALSNLNVGLTGPNTAIATWRRLARRKPHSRTASWRAPGWMRVGQNLFCSLKTRPMYRWQSAQLDKQLSHGALRSTTWSTATSW